jgi:long-chain acyl-CoA synthetase
VSEPGSRGTPDQLGEDRTLAEMFQRLRVTHAERPAVVFRDQSGRAVWSYADLGRNADAVANLLRSREIGKGERVVIWAPNGPWWAATLLGCIVAGVVVVPLDVNGSPEFARQVAELMQARLIVAGAEQRDALGEIAVPVVSMGDLPELVACAPAMTAEPPAIDPADLVEIVYTSGTTGHPRGVMISHRNLLANINALPAHLRADPSYCMLSVLPLSHLFEQTVGFWYLLFNGARVVYPRSIQASAIFEALAEEKVIGMLAVPQVLALFYRAIEREVQRSGREKGWRFLHRIAPWLPFGLRRYLFPSLHRRFGGAFRFFVSGGAGLQPELAQRWENMGVAVVQGYGLTECSPVVAATSLTRRPAGAVGKPLASCEIRLAEDGEILVRGPSVTAGYWQDSSATADAFDDGWYRTGDLGSIDQDGYLRLKGRKKNLIVLGNGMNVYPEDIEAVLMRNPAVREAVVIGVPRGDSDVEVQAVFVLNEQADPAAIVREANRQLAAHQHIRRATVWPEPDFPRTPTMKVKRAQIAQHFALPGQAG